MTTATTLGAREHARAQADNRTGAMPVVPASGWPDPPAGVDAERLTWAETVPGGRYTNKVLGRGTRLRRRRRHRRRTWMERFARSSSPTTTPPGTIPRLGSGGGLVSTMWVVQPGDTIASIAARGPWLFCGPAAAGNR